MKKSNSDDSSQENTTAEFEQPLEAAPRGRATIRKPIKPKNIRWNRPPQSLPNQSKVLPISENNRKVPTKEMSMTEEIQKIKSRISTILNKPKDSSGTNQSSTNNAMLKPTPLQPPPCLQEDSNIAFNQEENMKIKTIITPEMSVSREALLESIRRGKKLKRAPDAHDQFDNNLLKNSSLMNGLSGVILKRYEAIHYDSEDDDEYEWFD